MDYNEIVEQIKAQSGPQQAALFIIIVRECIKNDIFQPEAMVRIVKEQLLQGGSSE